MVRIAVLDDYQDTARELASESSPSVVLEAIVRRARTLLGTDLAYLTLDVGPGTFLPVRTDDPSCHQMHTERFTITAETVSAVREAKNRGGRVVAVGTTVVRSLEAAWTEDGLTAPNIQLMFRGVSTAPHLWFPGIRKPQADLCGVRPVLFHPFPHR